MKKIRLFALLLPFLAMHACKRPQAFEYREVKDIQLKHLGLSRTAIGMNLVYYNPNSFGVTLKKIDCDVYLNQSLLGKYLLDTSMHIDKRSVFVVPASVEFNWGDFLKKGFSILMNQEALVSVKGNTRIGKAGINVNVPLNFETKYKFGF
ncbi:LEA type 2 family protein [Parasediminibacterium sp. JCM 36343]|uniref:LEA type 2 family protein n=1 Tax=Parasediminibacterium sp. JCM 36343 TaxID=3374279 RepID=UPI0039791F02